MTRLEKFKKTAALKCLKIIAEDYGGKNIIDDLICKLENELSND